METSLKELEGVKSAQVSFQTKQTAVEFDESVVTASEVAKEMAATPHMMGKDMKYGGALLLKADRMRSRNDATAMQKALSNVRGVRKVTPDTRSQTIAVEFAGKDEVTTADLIDAGKRAGYTLTTLAPATGRRRTSRAGGSGGGRMG